MKVYKGVSGDESHFWQPVYKTAGVIFNVIILGSWYQRQMPRKDAVHFFAV